MSEAGNDAKTFSRNAKGVRELLSMKFETLPFEGEWYDAFGTPENRGIWIVWGKSGSGKTSFVMQLCKELCKYGRVVYDSLEEGISLTMQNTVRRSNMLEANRRFLLVSEPMEELSLRLKRQKSPDFVVIDSFQYTQMNYPQYIKFKEQHRNKLLIFISHASGQNPDGRPAKKVLYDASLKIYVEGKRAHSHGRFIGSKGYYDIWQKEAEIYYGDNVRKID
jgi:molybdopterin-guanine dinucleotide biosynthesis protein